jgi:hypothetical protein
MKRLLFILGLGIITGFATNVAWAHGGGVPQLVNADAGPYWVSVWTQPDPLRVGQAHITVAVSEPSETGEARREAGAPVLNAQVQVQFIPLDHDLEPLTVSATHEEAANKLLYEADLTLPETGRWQAFITVDGPASVGSVDFEAQVFPPQRSNWTWIGGLGGAALLAVWVVGKIRDRKVED